jgi:hypothetical protein
MIKRILLSFVLTMSLAGALAACNNNSTTSTQTAPALSSPAASTGTEASPSTESVPSTESSAAPSSS